MGSISGPLDDREGTSVDLGVVERAPPHAQAHEMLTLSYAMQEQDWRLWAFRRLWAFLSGPAHGPLPKAGVGFVGGPAVSGRWPA
jgi:hypothetical protein